MHHRHRQDPGREPRGDRAQQVLHARTARLPQELQDRPGGDHPPARRSVRHGRRARDPAGQHRSGGCDGEDLLGAQGDARAHGPGAGLRGRARRDRRPHRAQDPPGRRHGHPVRGAARQRDARDVLRRRDPVSRPGAEPHDRDRHRRPLLGRDEGSVHRPCRPRGTGRRPDRAGRGERPDRGQRARAAAGDRRHRRSAATGRRGDKGPRPAPRAVVTAAHSPQPREPVAVRAACEQRVARRLADRQRRRRAGSMTRTTVVIADYDYGDVDIERAIIERAGFELIAAQCKTEDEVIEVAHDAAAVVAQYTTISARVIAALPACRVIARYGTGVDIVDVEAATRHNILVTNLPNDWYENEVADHALALLLAVSRKINVYDRATRAGIWKWQTGAPIHRLRGGVLGLLSFGAIAKAIAARAAGFGMLVIAHDPYLSDDEITAAGATAVSFDELVTESDCLVIQAPLTPETHHLFDELQLRRMKSTSILINTARGPIVDDRALYRALSDGWIAGAGLDDIEEEPAKVRDRKSVV